MVNEVVIALTGKTTGYEEYPELNVYQKVDCKASDAIQHVRDIMNTSDEQNMVTLLNIAMSDHYVSMKLPTQMSTTFHGMLGAKAYNTQLVSNPQGLAYTHPAFITPDLWPCDRVVKVRYSSDNKVVLTYCGKVEVVTCYYKENKLTPNWPKELGIAGSIYTTEFKKGFRAFIPFNLAYPAEFVADKLAEDNIFMDMLRTHNMSDEYYFASSATDKLALAVLLLYKEVFNVI